MKTKLTLTMNKEVIENAKRIAAQQGKSLSKLVEEYMDSLDDEEPKKNIMDEIDELMAPHRNRISKSLPKGKSYKEMIAQWRYEDYMKESAARVTKKKIKSK